MPANTSLRRRREEPQMAEKAAAAQEALEFFLFSISDPHNPRHCGRCLIGALWTMTAGNVPDTPRRHTFNVIKNDEYWNSFLRFLVIKRTDKQLDRLLTRFSLCSCRLTEKNISSYHAEEKKEVYTTERCAVIVTMFTRLGQCLSRSGVVSVAKGLVNTWPHLPSDLMPFGADSLVQSLLQWLRFVPDPMIVSVATLILRVCRSLIIPSLVKYRFSHYVVESTRAAVDLTVDSLAKEDTKRLVLALFRFHHQLQSFVDYFRIVFDDLPEDMKADIMRGCETKAMQVCSMLLYLWSNDCNDPIRALPFSPLEDKAEVMRALAWCCQDLFRSFHMHTYPRPDMPLHPSVVELDKQKFPPPAASVPEAVIFYIGRLHGESRCSALFCPNSIQNVGTDFQRCARCNTVSYCGRVCQAKAWREEEYPHKRVCPILRKLIDAGGGPGVFYSVTPIMVLFGLHHGHILENWKKAGISDDTFDYMRGWVNSLENANKMPNGTEWTPGYEDYDEMIEELVDLNGGGPKPQYMDRLARWPSEVTREKSLLELQAFWEEDIDC
ncbi:hypothetical protein GALMADRAFT_700867 [Galerina marginata CBS 339.88]|uniref:MYND-type domain-containing protein n=1 Tax=Galerina marginata (strain CBS 339.88) TaxID=685588 RepID=A0A067TW37_GALM3|nr:hypothetical protein GALMADRAFT_700867 [Galerina marginata CBS 339.88]